MDNSLYQKVLKDLSDGVICSEDAVSLFELVKNEPIEKRCELADRIYSEIGKELKFDIFCYSYLIQVKPEKKYVEELCSLILYTDKLKWKEINFLFGQVFSILFLNSELYDLKLVELNWKILYKAYEICSKEMNLELEFIPESERNQDLAIVITEQFLTEQHGPTKTALDRCYVLQKIMNKRVLLINTAEALSPEGEIPFFDIKYGNYKLELLDNNTASWKGETFQFYQCEGIMPDIDEMCNLIKAVQRLKPSIIVGVGVSGILSGFINQMIPMVDIGLTQSGCEITLVDYQVVDYNMLDAIEPLVKAMDKDMSHIIPGKFTFSLREQTEFCARADFGISDDTFVMAVVGGRLDYEMDEQFMSFLNDTLRDDMLVVVIGICDTFESKLSRYPKLQGRMLNFGVCTDVLSRLELCDLYVNPIRKGGGTSAVEAMFKGKPVVTVNYGDVAGIVGERFSCGNYMEMNLMINRYYEDKMFYKMQAKYARDTAAVYMDSETEFVRIIREYERLMKRQ
ncbi:MAG: hypothetical protein K2G45_04280 [Lachnospiraceae bacterium]|nr:hypothetical protein [Lachnospiraceae bacterium]